VPRIVPAGFFASGRGVAAALLGIVLVSSGFAQEQAPPPSAPSATAQWLAEQEPLWQAAFQREVQAPFDKGLAELNQQYLAKVDKQFEKAASDGKLDDAVIWRTERDRAAAANTWPPPSDADVPALIQPMRAAWRKSLAALEAERLGRANKILARYDAILAQNLDALTRRKRIDEALVIRAKREALKAAWLQGTKWIAPAALEEKPQQAEPPKTATAATPKPATPAPPHAKPKQMSDAAKHDLITRLLDMGARVEAPGVVKTIDQVPKKNIELVGVAFNPRRERQWTEEDFAIMPELGDVPNFGIEVPTTDAVMEYLRNFRGTKEIRLSNLGNVTVKGFQAVGSMPELERMTLGAMPIDDAGFRAVLQGPKLKRVALTSFETVTDAGWAGIATTNLEYLQAYVSPNVTAEGWAQLAGAKKLRELQINGKPPEGILAGVSKIHSLENLNIGFAANSPLDDEDLAPLGALPKLKVLTIGNCPITGAMFANWPERPELKILWLPPEAKLDDAGLAALLKALPKLEEFVVYFETVSDAQIQLLAKHKLPWLRLIKYTPDEVFKKLEKALPRKKVERLR
jgi:hypothetical protein